MSEQRGQLSVGARVTAPVVVNHCNPTPEGCRLQDLCERLLLRGHVPIEWGFPQIRVPVCIPIIVRRLLHRAQYHNSYFTSNIPTLQIWNVLGLGTPGTLWGCALRGHSWDTLGWDAGDGRGEEFSLTSNNPYRNPQCRDSPLALVLKLLNPCKAQVYSTHGYTWTLWDLVRS